ncbi:MAG TPA: plastocyanin/azurin family copper-binding protein [Frankiaceae bacterium]|nr:plastocyanin/azurin family copper-binding protein [Frankiaceae bacterium]
MLSSKRLVVALALPLVLTACAEKERVVPSDHATPRAVPAVPATVFPKPSSLAPTTEAPTGGTTTGVPPTSAAAGGGNAVTAMATNKFEPSTLNVKVGTTVTWTAQGYHTVDSGEPPTPAGGPLKAPGGFTTYEYTFDKAGTYKYFCTPHASLGMTGTVVVS